MLLHELHNVGEVNTLELQLDNMFRSLGLDVEFSRHFVQRILGRDSDISIDDVTHAFSELKKKYKKRLLSAKKKPGYEAVLKDFSKDLNVVFGIKGDELTNITIMKKDPNKFHVNNQGGDELKVQ